MIYLPYSNQYIGDRLATWMFYLNEVSSQLFLKSFFYVFRQIVKFLLYGRMHQSNSEHFITECLDSFYY